MKRRDFLSRTLKSSLFYGLQGGKILLPLSLQRKIIANPAAVSNRMLVHLMLSGGPDFRHLFVPPADSNTSSYGYNYWINRYTSHSISNSTSAWSSRYSGDYVEVTSGGQTFGILKSATWLIDQFNAGNVAIICNAIGSESRNHSHARLIQETGNANSKATQFDQDGWGGRLAQAVNNGKVVSATNRVRIFCNYPSATKSYDNANVISFEDSRNFGLYHSPSLEQNPAATDGRSIMSRALKSYYQAKRSDIVEPYSKFTSHETSIRNFGDLVSARLQSVSIPSAISNLYEGSNTLNSRYLGRQFRNIYDSYAANDILGSRVYSLDHSGFDTHRGQRNSIEARFNDLFATDAAFDALSSSFESNISGANDNTVYVIAGEFGRQIASNGDGGTDHGKGNTVLVIGNNVNGGVYGTMFPNSELVADAGYDKSGADIKGLTSFEAIFGRVCDWVTGGANGSTGDTILDRSNIIEETGGILSGLF